MKLRGGRLLASCVAAGALMALTVVPANAGSDDDGLLRTGGADDTPVRELLSNIPLDHRYGCVARDPADASFYGPATVAEAASISAAITCGPTGDVDFLGYWQFTDRDAMNRAHGAMVLNGGNTEDSDDCPVDGEWGFGDETDGKVTCFYATLQGDETIPPTVSRVWTDDRNLILGQVSLPAGNDDAFELRKWWRENAGPLESPDDSGFTDGVDTKASRALLAAIPKSTRRSCTVADPSDGSGELRSDRFYIEGYVTCDGPDPDVSFLTYASYDPDIVDDVLEQGWSPSTEELDAAADDDVCPATGTWTLGKGAKKRDVGEYTCYFIPSETGDYPTWAWTDSKQGILAAASGTDADPEVLHDWWLSDASGPLQP